MSSPAPAPPSRQRPLIVDVHTHMYPTKYLDLLKARTSVPYVAQPPPASAAAQPIELLAPRLVILPTDDNQALAPSQRGRPLSSDYWSVERKKLFMSRHGIHASVVSLANPWLDWVEPADAAATARLVNDDLDAICAESHGTADDGDGDEEEGEGGRGGLLYHFATLPLSAPVPELVASIAHVRSLRYVRGVVLGTSGLGRGLDDAALDPVWAEIERAGLMVFVHPHYGIPGDVFGPRALESGHVMPLALGFPMETTVAFTRMYLAAVFERFPRLKVLLAHAGGTLPFLAGRLESCVLHERAEGVRTRTPIWTVLRNNVWLDGVVYSEVGLKAAIDAVGRDKVLWGTDHPFFPPLDEDEKGDTLAGGAWLSVSMNIDAATKAFGDDADGVAGVLGQNAARALGLDLP